MAQTRQLNPQAWLIPAPAIDLPAGTVIHNGPLTVVAP
jgi:hypothetical protein